MTHACRNCDAILPATEEFFYRAGAYFNWICKPCMKAYTSEWRRKRLGRTGARSLICGHCGSEYVSDHRKSMFCTRACSLASRHQRDIAERRAAREQKVCPHCSVAFAGFRLKKFCSEACGSAAHNLTRKLKRRAGALDSDGLFSVAYIAERDRWRCGLCRRRISKKLHYPDPMCLSMDHIVPVSDGGSNERANLQASHLVCNLRKRNMGEPQQLRLLG